MDDVTYEIASPDDESLIQWLSAVASGVDQDRHDALHALANLPGLFWTLDRIAGAMGALVPIAQAEGDEDIAFSLWNQFAVLFTRYSERSGESAATAFFDTLVELLDAPSAEIRGFAVTALGGSRHPDATRHLARALRNEERWDVTMRIITALATSGARLDADSALDLLEAGAEEAVLYGIRQIGEHVIVAGRRALHDVVFNSHRHHEEINQQGRWALDRIAAAEFREALPYIIPTLEWREESDARGERLTGLLFDNADLGITTTIVLPGTESLFRVPEARVVVDFEARDEHVAWVLERIARAIADVAGHNRSKVDTEEAHSLLTVELGMRPRPTLERLVKPLEVAVEDLKSATLRDGHLEVSAFEIDRLERAAGRIDALRETFVDLRIVDGADGHRYALYKMGRVAFPSGELAIAFGVGQDAANVFDPENGWIVSVALGDRVLMDFDARTTFGHGLANLLGWKFGFDARVVGVGSEGDPSVDHVFTESPTSTIHVVMQAYEPEDPSTAWVIDTANDIAAFLERLGELTTRHVDPFELVGLSIRSPSGASVVEDDEPTLEVPSEDILAAHGEPPVSEAPVSLMPFPRVRDPNQPLVSPHDEMVGLTVNDDDELRHEPLEELARTTEIPLGEQFGATDMMSTQTWVAARDPEPSPPTPEPTETDGPETSEIPALPPPEPEKLPSLDSIPEPPKPKPQTGAAQPGSGRAPLDDKGRTPSDVVRSLSEHSVELCDVHLRAAGHNTAKLAQIMSILLGMDMDEAKDLIARAPCMICEGVPRDRGRTINTVLKGTGAKIVVTPHGDEAVFEDDEDDDA